MIITRSKHALRFGDLDWKSRLSDDGWRMRAMAEGASFGAAVPVEQTLAHQLLDGSLKRRKRHENRTAVFDVVITGANSLVLGMGGQALHLACAKPTTLMFTPPDGLGVQTVFDVVVADAQLQFSDVDESNLRRRYRVTIECLPFGRSPEPVTDRAVVVDEPAGEQEINDCDALTGFTGLAGSTAVLDTSVKFEGTGSIMLTGQDRTVEKDGARATVTEIGTVQLTGLDLTSPDIRPFISFVGYVKDCVDFSATLDVNGVPADFVSAIRENAEWATFTFHTDVTDTITTLVASETIVGDFPLIPVGEDKDIEWVPNVPSSWAPRVDKILRNGAASPVSRQSLRLVHIRGAARTQPSLLVSHPTDGLSKTMILMTPSFSTGFDPALMKHCTVSTTDNALSMSGQVKAFSNTRVPFEFPAAQLVPGSFQLMGFLQTGDLGDEENPAGIVIRMSTKIGGVTLSEDEHVQRIKSTGDGEFDFVDCGPITLPSTNVPPGSEAIVRIEIVVVDMDAWQSDKNTTGSFGSSFQEFFLIPLVEDTALNIIDCGETGAAEVGEANSKLFMDSATLASPNPSIWVGTEADRTDAYHAAGLAMRWQPPSFPPGDVLLYVANSGGADATVDVTYDMRWPDFAAE